MDIWGNINLNFGFGINNWFMPNFLNFRFFPSFSMPIFNFVPFYPQNIWTIFPQNTTNCHLSSRSRSSSFSQNISTNVKSNVFTNTQKIKQSSGNLILDGYNKQAGERLANIALSNSKGWSGYCAKSVKTAIQNANLGTYQYGHAYQMTDILRNNRNFKEISTENIDVSKLPAGCILVYNKGVQGYSSKYGHTEITTGDGRAVSDGITQHLHKKPSAIFIPAERSFIA